MHAKFDKKNNRGSALCTIPSGFNRLCSLMYTYIHNATRDKQSQVQIVFWGVGVFRIFLGEREELKFCHARSS